MNKRITGGLLVLIAVATPILLYASAPTSMGQQQEVVPLYNKTRHPIPGNLPWYPVVVFGDNRPRAIPWVKLPQVFYDSIREISMVNPVATIGLGDHVGQGSKRQYKEFYRAMNESGLENQLYAMGNHDVSYGGAAWKYWARYMGPYTLVFDDIPGWRIAVLDTEGKPELWRNGVEEAYRGLGDRSLIVAFHRPIKPYVHHNLQDDYPEKAELLLERINETGQPVLVLQAHWHGWAEYKSGDTTWLIVGSLGAPLYKASDCEAAASCASSYNYLVLLLYPDHTYRYIPVKAGKGSGNFTVEYVNETYVLVGNSKVTVYGDPAEMPVRLQFNVSVDGRFYRVYYVSMIPPNATVYVRLLEGPSGYRLESNATSKDAYVYIVEADNESAGATVVAAGSLGGAIDITGYVAPSQATTTATTSEAMTTATATTTHTSQPTEAKSTTRTATTTKLTTAMSSTEAAGEKAGANTLLIAAYILAIVAVAAGIYLASKR